MDLTERLGAILRAHAITEIVYSLNGSGDSGDTDFEGITYHDDLEIQDLPDIPIFIADNGAIRYLPALLEGIVSDAPDGDWVNNEGGRFRLRDRPIQRSAQYGTTAHQHEGLRGFLRAIHTGAHPVEAQAIAAIESGCKKYGTATGTATP